MAFDGTAIDCTALPGGALLFVFFGGGGIIAVARVAPSDGSICCLGGGGNGGLLFFATGPLDFCTGAGSAGSQTSAFALAFRRAPFLSLRAAILNISLFPRSKSLAFLLAIRFLIGSSSEEFGSSMISSRFESGSYQPPGGPLFRPRRLFLAGGCLTSGFSRSLVFAWLLEYAQQLVTVLLWLFALDVGTSALLGLVFGLFGGGIPALLQQPLQPLLVSRQLVCDHVCLPAVHV